MSFSGKRTLPILVVAALLGGAAGVAAHPLAPALYELREQAAGEVEVRFKRPRMPSGQGSPRPVLPEGCEVLERGAGFGEAGSRVETWRLACGEQGLSGRRVAVEGIAADESGVVLRVERVTGGVVRGMLRAGSAEFEIPARESALQVLSSYGRLGFDHIGSGADHLLFILGLVLLAATRRQLLGTITAFTVGHSITLGLAALDLFRLAPAPVEIGIAGSLLYLGVELARPIAERRSVSALLAGLFGLLHGLGFAGALREAGLPAEAVPLALLGFNLGIEIGQLAFVALLLTAVGLLRLAGMRGGLGARIETLTHPARIAVAYGVGGVAAFWMFERLAALVR